MPELPDVAIFGRYLDATALHQEIAGTEVREERLLHGLTPGELEHGLTGRRLVATRRHGKYLFAPLDGDDGEALVLHFGMTGRLQYYKRSEKEPEYARVVLRFANAYSLAIVSKRLLGEVGLTADPAGFVEEKDLGPDALHDLTDPASFRDALAGRRGMIKSALMNQQIVAGIGNVYADEILFQAGIDPRTGVRELNGAKLGELFRTMRRVLQTAVERRAEPADYPRGWLTPRREEGASCPRRPGSIERIEVSGRPSYWCPACQRRPS